jgi:hypothetical protein
VEDGGVRHIALLVLIGACVVSAVVHPMKIQVDVLVVLVGIDLFVISLDRTVRIWRAEDADDSGDSQ